MQCAQQLFTNRRSNTSLTRRERLPWPKDQPFKILSLDGGGIRGLYAATLLTHIEREIIGGRPISSYFDMIAGTSTGGIIAIALGLNLPTARIEKLYQEEGGKIFHRPWYWKYIPFLRNMRHLLRPLYKYDALEKLLYREFGERIFGEATTRLVVPAFMAPKTEIAVFKTDHHPDFKNDWSRKAWELARATSAAPTYLGGYESGDMVFLDGGVWANNPIMVAIVDALSAYDISREQIEILSIGTGNFPFSITLTNAKRGLWSWREVIKGAMFLTTDNAHAQAGLLLGPEKITRLEPDDSSSHIEMDDYEGAKKLLPNMAIAHFEANKNSISKFFSKQVIPRKPFYARSQSNEPTSKN